MSIATMLVAVSCQLNHRDGTTEDVETEADDPATGDASTQSAATTSPSDAGEDDAPRTALVVGDRRYAIARIVGDGCRADLPLHLELTLASRFGDSKVKASLSALVTPANAAPEAATAEVAPEEAPASPPPSEGVHVEVDGAIIDFPAPAGLLAPLRARICAAGSAGEIALDPETEGRLREIVEQVAPDCESFSITAGGYACHLPTTDPEAARMELAGIQSSMIRRWTRQPYLLARRLAIGMTLAQALQSTEPLQELDTFCRLIQSSLPTELPATLASKRWQGVVCAAAGSVIADTGSDQDRLDAALFGLTKVVGEIDVMRQLFERTSRLGHLSVRIPARELTGRRVLVSLTPTADVAENLTRETALLYSSEPLTNAFAEDAPRSCWHPLFSESPELFSLARQLTLVGEGDHLSCSVTTGVPASNPAFTPDRYFAESITSETEFVVTNGRAKTLRLPMGHYSYTLRELPDDPDAWDDASQVPPRAGGTIAWDTKRPRAVITEW